MLTVNYSDDDAVIKKLFEKLDLHDEPTSGIIALLYDEDRPIGYGKMLLTEAGCEIINFMIDKENDDYLNADFFFRTVLFKLSRTEVKVIVKTDDKRLEKFGFRKTGEYMTVRASDITFPSSCGGEHAKK